jgi:predicted GTPase
MAGNGSPRRALILGAAGRDFHDFNVFFRHNPAYRVVGFTATQIPYIAQRTYPPHLAGALYPEGISIHPEEELPRLLRELAVQDVFFAYSDVSHAAVMHLAATALAAGASFHLLGPADTQLTASRPVVAVLGARTGAGKSTVTRYLYKALQAAGRRPVAVRHPMPYGRFDRVVERYATDDDVVQAPITVEEMEEYQQHVDQGGVVFAGVDYAEVLRAAEREGDLILWDGGNNDMAFFRPDVTVTVADPLRPAQEEAYFPGEANIRAADILVVNKVNAAAAEQVETAVAALRRLNPTAEILLMESVESVDHPERVKGRRVLVVEDGPSVTHGGLKEAVGARAARLLGASLVDPRPAAGGSLRRVYEQFPHLGDVLPALGYSAEQLAELERSINGVECGAVVLGTPANLARVIRIGKPVARVRFEARDKGGRALGAAVMERLGLTGESS